VSADLIINNLLKNVEVSQEIIRRLVGRIPNPRRCDCHNALKNAIVTSRKHISEDVKRQLEPLIGKYLAG
jgi:5'-methylthioadenosine phosphorylase